MHGADTLTTIPEGSAVTPQDHIAICVKAVVNYRGQEIGKWEAISQILGAIQLTTASMDSEQRTTASKTYLAMLDGHDWLLAKAIVKGNQEPNQVKGGEHKLEEDLAGEDQSQSAVSQSDTVIC